MRYKMPAAARVMSVALAQLAALLAGSAFAQPREWLPSWNDGAAKTSIVAFV